MGLNLNYLAPSPVPYRWWPAGPLHRCSAGPGWGSGSAPWSRSRPRPGWCAPGRPLLDEAMFNGQLSVLEILGRCKGLGWKCWSWFLCYDTNCEYMMSWILHKYEPIPWQKQKPKIKHGFNNNNHNNHNNNNTSRFYRDFLAREGELASPLWIVIEKGIVVSNNQ